MDPAKRAVAAPGVRDIAWITSYIREVAKQEAERTGASLGIVTSEWPSPITVLSSDLTLEADDLYIPPNWTHQNGEQVVLQPVGGRWAVTRVVPADG